MRVKFSSSKTNVLYLSLGSLELGIHLPVFGGAPLVQSLEVWNLGVILDTSLSMEVQVTMTSTSASYYLSLIRHLVPYLDSWDLDIMIHAVVTFKMDYCNSLYLGLPLILIWKLWFVQNVAAYMLTVLSLQRHIQPVLHQLHCLL